MFVMEKGGVCDQYESCQPGAGRADIPGFSTFLRL